MNENIDITLQKNFEEDLKYINSEIIAKQPNNNYCKFSRLLNAVSVFDISAETYLKYWKCKYKNEKYKELIIKASTDKLDNGLVSCAKMIELINNSNDETSDKYKALKFLKNNF